MNTTRTKLSKSQLIQRLMNLHPEGNWSKATVATVKLDALWEGIITVDTQRYHIVGGHERITIYNRDATSCTLYGHDAIYAYNRLGKEKMANWDYVIRNLVLGRRMS